MDSCLSSAAKRHKKHKKHKKKKISFESDLIDVVNDNPPISSSSSEHRSSFREVPPIIDNSAIKQYHHHHQPNTIMAAGPSSIKGTPPSSKSQAAKKRKHKGKESETSSDEERWLDAIESGKLEEVDDELKKIKDPKLMTARQRAMYERGNDKEPSPGGELLMSLPTGYKEKVMTAEAIQKAQLKSQKRKQLADEKREKDKKKTMERLLKKQETKTGKQSKSRIFKSIQPMITYRHTADDGGTLSLPADHEFPLKMQSEAEPPKPIICGVTGCNNLKIYSCSKTKIPLCSFACYKRNMESAKDVIRFKTEIC